MPLSLHCFFVNRCGLPSTLTVKLFSMCFHKNPFLVSWACPKSLFSNMHNVVLHASFRLSKRAVVTKQSKTPSYETPNWLFCPLVWLHSILVAWTFLMFVPHFLMPVVAKPKTMKQRQFCIIVDDCVNCFSPRCSRKTTNNATYWAEEKMLLTSVKCFSCNKRFNTSQR